MTSAAAPIVAVGAGRMGRGMALAFAYAGRDVVILDLKQRPPGDFERLAAAAGAEIAQTLAALHALGAIGPDDAARILARVSVLPIDAAEAPLATADVVLEGVTETLEAKRDAFAFICRHARDDAVLASTTSTLLVTELVPLVTRPERLLNAHWLNPAYLVPLVELSVHPGTAPQPLARLRALLEDIGKVPVVCGPAPGYIVPRLQALLMNEAARMVEEGAASAEDIDRATRYGLGFRFAAIGVVEFIDFGGADILWHASGHLSRTVSAERYAAPEVIERMMREGRTGLREGAGFYDYAGRDVPAYKADVLARTLAMLRHAGLYRPPR